MMNAIDLLPERLSGYLSFVKRGPVPAATAVSEHQYGV